MSTEDKKDDKVLDETIVENPELESVDVELSLTEDVNVLLDGAEVSDEFKEKFTTILEAVVTSKVAEAQDTLKEAYQAKLDEAVEQIEASINEDVSMYIEYVVNEWLEENQVAIEAGVKVDMAEAFMEGMKTLFTENYAEVPEGKEDILSAAEKKAADLEESLNTQIERASALAKEVESYKRSEVIATVSEGLTDTQKEKLGTLIEGVEFKDAEQFTEKVKTIRESYFKGDSQEEINEDKDKSDSTLTEEQKRIKRYAEFLG